MLTFGSLFAGIGGFDLGFERAGLKCAWQVEKNPFCLKILAKHWPDVVRHGDIKTFPVKGKDWSCDIITAGFPCKQTSVGAALSKNRKGLEGKDSGLYNEMLRVMQLVKPRAVVVENVGGSGTWKTEIRNGLESIGYRVPKEPFEVSAKSFGAPHLRKRLLWVAYASKSRLEITRIEREIEEEYSESRRITRDTFLEGIAGIVRISDGVSPRLDRSKRIIALGNSFMPQKAEMIGRVLKRVLEEV